MSPSSSQGKKSQVTFAETGKNFLDTFRELKGWTLRARCCAVKSKIIFIILSAFWVQKLEVRVGQVSCLKITQRVNSKPEKILFQSSFC